MGLFFSGLWCPQILHYRFEDMTGVVTQCKRRHSCRGWQAGGCKCLPPQKDDFHVFQNESIETHVSSNSRGCLSLHFARAPSSSETLFSFFFSVKYEPSEV